MKTILVPTDFSGPATHALQYAAVTAAQTRSRLVLVHAIAFQMLSTPEGGEVALPPDPREEAPCLQQLAQFQQQIRADHGAALETAALCVHGSLPDTLNRLVASHRADLVVMGTRGARRVPDTWLGTNTFHFIRQAVCPVLAVPEKAGFQPIRRIAYASDFETEDESPYLRQLLAFAAPFSAELYIINVKSDEQLGVVPDWKVLRNIQARFPDNPFRIAQVRDDDVAAALQDFVLDNQMDILAAGIQERSFLERIFHSSITRQLAFHSSRPLLTLPRHPYQAGNSPPATA